MNSRRIARAIMAVCLLAAAASLAAKTAVGPSDPRADRLLRWMVGNRQADFSLPYSHVGDPELADFIILYDAAVCVMAYLVMDRVSDATDILDFYLNDPQVSRLGGFIEVFRFNPYFSGVDYSVRMGANIWMGLAAFHAFRKTGEKRFLDLSKKQADLALSVQVRKELSPNYGGVPLGPKGDPAFEADQRLGFSPSGREYVSIFSTEINVDSYALFNMLARQTGDSRYADGARNTLRWIRANAWNRAEGRFNRGFGDGVVATDVQSWGVSALGLSLLDSFTNGLAVSMLAFAESNCVSETEFRMPGGRRVKLSGADFTDRARATQMGRGPVVSPEWTFQLINAYGRLVRDLERAGKGREAAEYRRRREELTAEIFKMAVDSGGALAFPYASSPRALIGHEHRTPADGNLSVIGNAYGILALKGFDPLVFPE